MGYNMSLSGDEDGVPKAAMSMFEWYSRWALEHHEPCDTCPPEYKMAYGRLQGLLEAADACFRSAYDVSAELSRMRQNEQLEV